jgi:hypothetical protein
MVKYNRMVKNYPHEITFNPSVDKFDGPKEIYNQILEYPLNIIYN